MCHACLAVLPEDGRRRDVTHTDLGASDWRPGSPTRRTRIGAPPAIKPTSAAGAWRPGGEAETTPPRGPHRLDDLELLAWHGPGSGILVQILDWRPDLGRFMATTSARRHVT